MLRWLFVAVMFGFVAKLGSDDLGGGVWGFLLPAGAVLAAVFVLTALHEGGHLLAAVALRLKVLAVRVRFTGRSFVRVGPSAAGRPLPPRMVLFLLAGPAVDVLMAVGLLRSAIHPMPALARDCVLASGLTAAVLGLGNLLPRSHREGGRSDGSRILDWTFHPARQRAKLAAGTVDVAALRRVADESVEDGELDAFIDATTNERARALAVYLRFRRTLGLIAGVPVTVDRVTIGPSAAADFQSLIAYVVQPGTPDQLFDPLASSLATVAALWQQHRVLVAGVPPDPSVVAQIEELSAALDSRRPGGTAGPVVRAMLELLRGDPAAARDTLRGVEPSTDLDATRALLVRAVAEAALGDHAEADRLVEAVARVHADAGRPEEGELQPVMADMLAALPAATPS